MTSRDSRASNASKARYTSVSATDTRHRLLRYFTSRARWLAATSLAGLATPLLSGLLAGSFGTIVWLVDLVSHWQWLYLAVLVPACLVLIREDRRWGFALLAVPLPWMTVSESAPPSTFEPLIPVLTVASANVHVEKSDAPPLARWLLEASPDVVVLHEVSPAYAEQLQVYRQYPFKHLAPANDPFGVAILSRFPLTNVQTVTGDDGIPHVKAVLDWNGHLTTLIAWHPMPPLSPRDHHARNTLLSALAEAAHHEGKPTILADLGPTPPKPLLGLPGHPASAAVVMEVLGRPLLSRLAGASHQPPWERRVAAVLSRNLAGASGREDFVRVRLRHEGETLWADPVLGPSGLLSPLVKSDGLVMIPLGVEGLFKGETVTVQLFGGA